MESRYPAPAGQALTGTQRANRSVSRHMTLTLKRPVAPPPHAPAKPKRKTRKTRVRRPVLPTDTMLLELSVLAQAAGSAWPSILLPPGITVPSHPKPMAVGIRQRLRAILPNGNKVRLKDVLTAWCQQPSYLRALAAPGAMRHGPDGQPTEPVSELHREQAIDKLRILTADSGP